MCLNKMISYLILSYVYVINIPVSVDNTLSEGTWDSKVIMIFCVVIFSILSSQAFSAIIPG